MKDDTDSPQSDELEDSGSASEVAPAVEPEPEVAAEPESAAAEAAAAPGTEPEVGTGSDAGLEPEPETESEVKAEPEPETESEGALAPDCEERIVRRGMLHNLNGRLNARGWATEPLLRYDRARIKAPKYRIKEWDYYLINDDEYAIALTIGDLGYMGLISASVINLVHPGSKTVSVMVPLPMGRMNLPSSSVAGVSHFKNARVEYNFRVDEGQRRIVVRFNDFQGSEPLVVDALLDRPGRQCGHAGYLHPETRRFLEIGARQNLP